MDEDPRSSRKTEAAPPHAFKYTEFQDDPASTHSKIVSLVPPATRVLEFGCATGYMSEVLKNRLGCTVVGIEIDRDAAALAEQHTERVIVGDAEKIDYAAELAGEEFDVVLFADVLEHLKEPADVLRRVRPFVAENGVVVASIPNIAHASVRLALLGGEFRYREWGLLDDTHLRFFTRASIQDLFEETRLRDHALAAPAARRRRDRDQGAAGSRRGARVARLRSRGDDVPVRAARARLRARPSQLKS